jgi:hypothetical protein
VKRTAEWPQPVRDFFSRPFHGLCFEIHFRPSDESLGYYQPSAARTERDTFLGEAKQRPQDQIQTEEEQT